MATISANMSLPIPVVSETPGPEYASNINQCFTTIDSHDHASGSGVPITPDGMNITADLAFLNNNATQLRTARFQPGAALTGSASADVGCIYVGGVDLYYNDVNGNQVRITQDGGVTGTPGSIANLTSPASASYVSASAKFVWQSDSNVAASMDMRNAILRNSSASSNGLTLAPPAGMATNFTITLPNVPASSSFLTMDSSGNIGTPYPITGGIPLAALVTAVQNALVPAGAVLPYAGTSAPAGYLLCDGSAVSRTTYATLFAVIGITAGEGDGSTTFNIPDYRGRFMRGVDGGTGRDPGAAGRTAMNTGGNTGSTVSTLQTSEITAHSHRIYGSSSSGSPVNAGAASAAEVGGWSTGASAAYVGNGPTGGVQYLENTGGDESRPINASVNYIIKT